MYATAKLTASFVDHLAILLWHLAHFCLLAETK